MVAEGAGEALGQPMLIEYVPGAGGNIGTARVAKAAPDKVVKANNVKVE